MAALTHEATKRKDPIFKKWVEEDRTLVILGVKDEEELVKLHREIQKAGIIHNEAVEPDWSGGPTQTALAIYPHDPSILKPFLSSLSLLK